MADKLDNEFQNIAKSMEDISKSTNDIRIKIRKDLIDSVKELSDVTKEYNDDLKTQETSWGRLLTSNKDYSKQIEKANKTAEEAEKRKTEKYNCFSWSATSIRHIIKECRYSYFMEYGNKFRRYISDVISFYDRSECSKM